MGDVARPGGEKTGQYRPEERLRRDGVTRAWMFKPHSCETTALERFPHVLILKSEDFAGPCFTVYSR